MRYWTLHEPRVFTQIDCRRVADLVGAIGRDHIFAERILSTVCDFAPFIQCAIFAYESCNRPRAVSLADDHGSRLVHDIAYTYTRSFYLLDGNQEIVSTPCKVPGHATRLLIHYQSRDDIRDEGYRTLCYDRTGVSERVALLQQPASNIWLTLNLYRGCGTTKLRPSEIDALESLAPVLAHAVRHHYVLHDQRQQDVAHVMLERLRSRFPGLTKRELDVICGILEGLSTRHIAERMSVKTSSVITYRERAYNRLGVSRQRELFALCMEIPAALRL